MNTEPDRYAVIGNPIAHSRSPEIHQLFADQTGECIRYEKILAEPGGFEAAVRQFFDAGGRGLNVTLPFKGEAFEFAAKCTDLAVHAGAVNTLIAQDDGSCLGANTDGIGLLRDLKKTLRLSIQNKRLLILGAGGATRGILEPLLQEKPLALVIANRTPERGAALVEHFRALGPMQSCALDAIPDGPYDLIVHATSAALQDQELGLPDTLAGPGTCCYDLIYSDTPTPFMRWAKDQRVLQVTDGFGMLLEQAAESFYLWRGKRPDTAMACNYLRPP
ncbi:MAG: shikimate dehydrogenase [Gammaproteobacteria bacterium]|nr:shikimate dehydrogenase [Gammaproteobacteria bacterium]